MRIDRYGITLRSIREDDLETVRVWRNSDLVRPNMFYQEIISETEQQEWFDKLDPRTNFYFMVCQGDTQIGVCNIRDIDWENGICEGGIFVGVERFLNSSVPIRAVLSACEYWFNVLTIEQVSISILNGNEVALRFNTMLGAKVVSSNDELISMRLHRHDFNSETADLRNRFDAKYHDGAKVISLKKESRTDKKILEKHRRGQATSSNLNVVIESLG